MHTWAWKELECFFFLFETSAEKTNFKLVCTFAESPETKFNYIRDKWFYSVHITYK